ncbi:hypothetical protein J4E86_000518 [Alternaria arbusti]|uniref:uncharacterized protein n=1 Tax=Alternaria arbusti TaxID=232088 RepID=UPI00221F3FCE|nr:uncharacterized protein J4E86_000518 [Alternaria arbusti]KAI4961490.1 hypothetical protein J4E86_000518 [Alternaria arbusti]
MEDSQTPTVLGDLFYDDPSQLSQALKQRACSDKPFRFTTSTESPHSGNHAPLVLPSAQHTGCVSLHLPVVLSPFNRALSPRRAATTKHVKLAALLTHHSAPTTTGNIKHGDSVFKMYHSFNMMDAPGDTQPDSQMMKTWTSGIYTSEAKEVNPPKSLFVDHSDDDNGDELPTDEMDIVASSQDQHMPTPTSPTVIDADDDGYAQNSMAPTSPLKFQTPALADRHRGNSGQTLSSAVRTNTTPATADSPSLFFPAFDNGGDGGLQHISLTQAFNNTQAPTSPAVGGVAEDVVFTRPSPNFSHLRHSSPIPAYSSPIKAMRPDTPKSDPVVRSSSEPRAEYVTMKQSQEKRRPSIGDEQSVPIDQDSWQELSRKVKAQKAREHAHRRAASSLSHISVPTPLVSRSGRKRVPDVGLPSPVKSRNSRGGEHSECPDDGDETMDEQSQPIVGNGVKDYNTEQLPDGSSQNAAHTARTRVRRNSNDNSVQVPKTSSHPHRTSRTSTQQAIPSSQLQHESQLRNENTQRFLRDTNQPPSSKESIAVMDSQPDATADFDSVPRPKSLRFPSSPSMNQYSINQTTMATKTGYTSQVISSSMPPMPPKSSLDDDEIPDGEERVPSSPPLLRPEDAEAEEGDLQYDEHTYDEYVEGAADRDTATPTIEEDTVMDEDEDLPLANEELEGNATIELQGEKSDEELDLVQPSKVDMGTDQQVPETFEQDQSIDGIRDGDLSRQNPTTEPPKPPSMRRQNTVPETDALDETQPTFFTENMSAEATGDDAAVLRETNSTEAFQTAQEEHSLSEPNKAAPVSSKDNGSDVIRGDHRIHSIDDIYNLPETQQSVPEEDIEMPRLSGLEDDDCDAFMAPTSPAPPSTKRRKVTYTAKRGVFRSPSKPTTDEDALTEPPKSPRLEQVQHAPEDTPPTASVQAREDKGALAATREREAVQAPYKRTTSLKSKILPKASRAQKERQGALKPVSRELLQSLSSPANSPAKPKPSLEVRKSTPLTPTKPREVVVDRPADVEMLDAAVEPDEPISSAPHSSNAEMPLETPSQRVITPPGEIIVPNRVFASWPGSHYYPATCIGQATARQLQIRYDDENITSRDAVHVRALSLRRGDQVKVDELGMKKNVYVVVDFKDRIDDLSGAEFPITDQRGYTTVVLEERARESLPKAKAMQPAEHISVPVGKIYLTASLWKRLRDRSFNFSAAITPAKPASHFGTPVADPFTTPSFSRRGTGVPSLLKDVTTRAASVASTARSGSGVFANMAFVLTSTAADVDKDVVARQIKSNGGQVLEQGFHELFESEPSEAPTSSQSRRRSASIEGSAALVLKQAYRDLGFVALISDSHSRSTKYIQALALNVPCLHLRWIHDSLNASRAAPFTRYLLPAGVSKFLDPNGVVRSRTMAPYDPAGEDVSFAQIIQDRDLLFQGQSVLLITGKSKKEVEKRQPFVFLSHALGSATVGRCADLVSASDMLTSGKWDWVYVDNGEGGVAEAAAMLLGTEKPVANGKTKKAKKRKRDETEVQEELLVKGEVNGHKVRITCAEFVIQSLILGALIEE